jgi:hypothetical protein
MTINIYNSHQHFIFLCICFMTIEDHACYWLVFTDDEIFYSIVLEFVSKILSPEAIFLVPDWGIKTYS